MTIDTVLFDLDNTLVLYDEPLFYQHYFPLIAGRFADLLPFADFRTRLVQAVRGLRHNAGRQINRRLFLSVFGEGLALPAEALWARFIAFYREDFSRIDVPVRPPEGLTEVLAWLQSRRLRLAVATNPIFPEFVQRQRLDWIGLAAFPFALISHIDNMSHVKPHPGYYGEVCRTLAAAPGRCLMVGNDAVNDMAAGAAGLHTYRCTDAELQGARSVALPESDSSVAAAVPLTPDFEGPLKGLPEALRRLGVG